MGGRRTLLSEGGSLLPREGRATVKRLGNGVSEVDKMTTLDFVLKSGRTCGDDRAVLAVADQLVEECRHAVPGLPCGHAHPIYQFFGGLVVWTSLTPLCSSTCCQQKGLHGGVEEL